MAQVFSCEFCEIFEKFLSYRTLPVATFGENRFRTVKFMLRNNNHTFIINV